MILRVPPDVGCVGVAVGDAVGDVVGDAVGSGSPQLANNVPPMTIRTIANTNILFTFGMTSSFYWICPIERSPILSFT